MSKLKTPFQNETSVIIKNAKDLFKIKTELASSDIEIFQSLNYRNQKDFLKPLTLKFSNPLIQSYVKMNFVFSVEIIAIDYITHKVKKIQLLQTNNYLGDFIQGFSEYAFVILAPRGFVKKHKIEENITTIKLENTRSLT